jgi:hypothetical protein
MHRTVERMLRTNPEPPFAPPESLSALIYACSECAQACVACADACIAEHVPRRFDRCLRIALDCGDICSTTARILSRQLSPSMTLVAMQVEVCASACELCATECEQHADYCPHCAVCAATCHRCLAACRALMTRSAPDRRYEAH